MENEIRASIQMVYGKLWDVIALYEPTKCYNAVPEGSKEEDIWSYMGTELLEIRKIVNKSFIANRDIREKLLKIVDETEHFVRKYEIPGVVLRWCQINPKILFFDCAFDLREEAPDAYKAMCRGLSNLKLACYPDEEFINAQKQYSKEIKRKNNNDNFRYSEERVFQDELHHTLTLVFENDCKEYL